MIRFMFVAFFTLGIIACSGTEPVAKTQPTVSYPTTSQQTKGTDIASCDALFINAKEIDTEDYLYKLREEALDEPFGRDTYWFKADSGKVAKNGPRLTWIYEGALNVASNFAPAKPKNDSGINFDGRQLRWDNYLNFRQSLCDAYYDAGTKRQMQINLEVLFDFEINEFHASNWPAFEYIETGPQVITPVTPPGLEYYTKYITGGGVIITAGSNMPDEALLAAREAYIYMTSARPEFRQMLQDNQVRLGLFSETASQLPEFPESDEEGGFSMGPSDTLMTANGLWQCWDINNSKGGGPGGNPVIHELVHTLNHVIFESINETYFYERIYDLALASIENGLFYTGFSQNLSDGETQDITNYIGEFWAISVEGYIMDGGPAYKNSHYSHEWIQENDPDLYDLIIRYFPTEKWNYSEKCR